MAITLVAGQTASKLGGNVTSTTIVLTNNPTTGNLVVVGVSIAPDRIPSTVTVVDGASNAYAQDTSSPFVGNLNQASIFYLKNAPANANKTLTITLTAGGATDLNVFAAEFAGADTTAPFDKTSTQGDATSSTNVNGPAINATNDGSLLFCCCTAGGTISTANSPWTGVGVPQNGNYAEYLIQGAHASQAIAFTQSPASTWTAIVSAFIPAVAGPTITFTLGDYTLDNGLTGLDTVCDKMYVCAAAPSSYADATSGANSLGSKNWGAGAAFGSTAARSGGGRQITSTAITDGTISTAGTVAAWAAVDSANSRLLAYGGLTGGKVVSVGQVFTLGAMTFGIPNT